jgi:DNA invertase Pin-like site-specific DNA recombinase
MRPRARRERELIRRRSRINRGMARRRRAGVWEDGTPVFGPINGFDLYLIQKYAMLPSEQEMMRRLFPVIERS